MIMECHLLPVNLQKQIILLLLNGKLHSHNISDGRESGRKIILWPRAKSSNSNEQKPQREQKRSVGQQQRNCRIICGNSTKLLNTICRNLLKCIFGRINVTLLSVVHPYRQFGNEWQSDEQSNCMSPPFVRRINMKKPEMDSARIMAGNEKNSVLWRFEKLQIDIQSTAIWEKRQNKRQHEKMLI